MRCWWCVIPIVLGPVQGCAAPLVQAVHVPSAPAGVPGLSINVWPFVLAAILLVMAAFVGGIAAAHLVRRRVLSKAMKLRWGQAAPGELEKLQRALDLIEDVMAAIKGQSHGPRNKGG